MFPWSSGCRIEVVLPGKKFNFTLQSRISECDVASRNNKTFQPLQPMHLLNFFNQVLKVPDVIQAFLLALYSICNVFLFTCLKKRGFSDFQITNGISLSPTVFPQ